MKIPLKCPIHTDTELEKLPTRYNLHFSNNWYYCGVCNREWVINRTLRKRRRRKK